MGSSSKRWISELNECGALRKGHFRLSSGLHSDTYIQCALLLKEPSFALRAGKEIAELLGREVDLVASPAVGGIIIGFTVSLALGCPMIFSERVDGKMVLRRGFEIPTGARVLLVEDVITTGGSILELAGLVEKAGGIVEGIGCIVLRGKTFKSKYPVVSLLELDVPLYEASECPMCASGISIESPGSRYI